jgi:hypothetical protein
LVEFDCVGVEFGVSVVNSVDVCGVYNAFGVNGFGEEDSSVVGAGSGEVASADED